MDLDLRGLIRRYTLDVKGPDGEPVPFGFASYRRFGEETAALAIIRDGKAQLVSSSVGLAVHIEAEGCLPAKLPRVWGDQVVQLERAYKVIAKVPDGVEIPSKISPTQGTDFYLQFDLERDEWWRSPVISQVGEGAQNRDHWGETVALDVNGDCLNVHYSQIHSLPGWKFRAVVDASSREGWMFVPAVGGYEGTWSYTYQARDSGGGSGSGSQIKSSNDGSAEGDDFELKEGDVEVRLDIPLTQAGIDSTISQIYERHDWGRWGDLEDDVSEEGVDEGL
jgi:hypothetical protein